MSEPDAAPKPTYYLRSRGETTGPHDIAELQAFVKTGRLTPSHELSQDGILWMRAGQFWEVFQLPEKPKILRPRSRSRSAKPAPAKVAPSAAAAKPIAAAKPTDAATSQANESLAPESGRLSSPYDAEASGVMTWSLVTAALLALGVVSSSQLIAQVLAMHDRLDGTLESVRRLAVESQAGNSGAAKVLQTILGLGLFAAFLAWQFMASRNLAVLRDGRMRFTPWAGIGWYFMPIGNLWKPYQVMREIIQRSEEGAARPLVMFPSTQVLAAWWVLLVARLPVRYVGLVHEGRIVRALEATPTEMRLQSGVPKVSEVPGLVQSWLLWDGMDGLLTLLAYLLSIWIVVSVGYLQYCAFRARARRAD